MRECIHRTLERERALDVSGRAKGIHRASVQVDEGLSGVDVRALIQLVKDLRGAREPATVPVGDTYVGRNGDERSVAMRSECHFVLRRSAIARIGLFAFAIEDATHGTAELSRQRDGGVRVGSCVVLRAEAPAHVVLHHANAIERQLERARDVSPNLKDSLRALPYSEITVAHPFSDGTMWLEQGVDRARCSVFVGDDDVRFGERRADVTALFDAWHAARHVAAGLYVRRILSECDVERHRVRRCLDVQVDERTCLARELRRVGAQSSERLACPVNRRVEQWGTHVRDALDVRGDQCSAHARQRECTCEIEPGHSAAGDWCAHERRVEHRAALYVSGVARAAGHLLGSASERGIRCPTTERDVSGVPRRGFDVREFDDLDLFAALDFDLGADESLVSHLSSRIAAAAAA